MMSKLLSRTPSRTKEVTTNKSNKITKVPSRGKDNQTPGTKEQITGGMYFDMREFSNDVGPLLLPDESCLAEDLKAEFSFHCEREGFHLFNWGDVNFYNVRAKIYLTTYRLIFVPYHGQKQKYTSFSVCVEAIRDPNVTTIADTYMPLNMVEFSVCMNHGTKAHQQYHDSYKTVNELFDTGNNEVPPHPHIYRNCQINMNFERAGKARLFLKGINLVLSLGVACPTRQCRFIEYEDLPVYSPTAPQPPAFDKLTDEKLAIC